MSEIIAFLKPDNDERWDLKIEGVRHDDQGHYKCVVQGLGLEQVSSLVVNGGLPFQASTLEVTSKYL